MTHHETESVIADYIARFNAGDLTGMLELLAEDVIHDINQGAREIGREKFQWFLANANRHYRETLEDVVILTSADGHRASAECTVRGQYLATAKGLPEATGQSYSLSVGLFFEIDDGLISRVTSYYNLEDWKRQVEGRGA